MIKSKNLAKEGKYEDAVIELVRERDHVTWAEIEQILAPFIDVKGDVCMELEQHHNLILWAGMSQEFADIMHKVHGSRKLTVNAASLLLYVADGRMLNMPIAKKVKSYEEPHWIPMCFRLASSVND